MDDNDDIIGTDIGLDKSYAAIIRVNISEYIIPNELGHRTTPSIVSFFNNKILIGEVIDDDKKNPSNKIYGIVNLIGKNYDDECIKNIMKKIPFKIIKDSKSNKIKIQELNIKEENKIIFLKKYIL